jgi:hypothetical protein
MHPDLVSTIYRQRMTSLVHEARIRRLVRQAARPALRTSDR